MKRMLEWSGNQQISQIYIPISILSGFFFFIWGSTHPLIPRYCQTFPLAKMSFSSKLKKVIPKGTVHELKLVQTIIHCGSDTLKTEDVKTLRHGQQTTPLMSKQDHSTCYDSFTYFSPLIFLIYSLHAPTSCLLFLVYILIFFYRLYFPSCTALLFMCSLMHSMITHAQSCTVCLLMHSLLRHSLVTQYIRTG